MKKLNKWVRLAIVLIAGAALIGALVWGGISLFRTIPSAGASASLMACPYSDTVRPFGKYVLYYDGLSIHCMNDTGSVRWSFQLGADGGYDCDDETIAAWTGPNLYILDSNGSATYNDNLGSEIQFARVGATYVAAVVGESTSPTLLVKDHTGTHMDEETEAYSHLMLLDVGFFGSSGQYMWTLALDVFGTAANTIMNTFEVGRMNTGEASLGEAITYAVVYENSVLRVINTRRMRTFSERGTEDASASSLVYGWRYLNCEKYSRGSAYLLFAPTTQTGSTYDIRELRLLSGSNIDKRFTLPDSCVGACVYKKNVYAVSAGTLYRAGVNDSRFVSWELPLQEPVTRYIGALSTGRVLVACGNKVYCVTLPTGSVK